MISMGVVRAARGERTSCRMELDIQARLLKHLGSKLYEHSLGVAQTAACLANRYGSQQEKAYLAGLVHDYGKVYPGPELVRLARQMGLDLDWISLAETGLLHAPVGAALLPVELEVSDIEIIKAVKYHTTCRKGASLLEKIVYLADYIEPGRRHPAVALVREAAENNLHRALLLAVEQTIRSVLDRGKLLHPRSVEFRNSLIVSKP